MRGIKDWLPNFRIVGCDHRNNTLRFRCNGALDDCNARRFYYLKVGKENAKFDQIRSVRPIKLLRHFATLGYDGAPCGGQIPDKSAV